MPAYTYRCQDCNRSFTLRISYADYGRVPVTCPFCGSSRVQRRYGRVAVRRGGDFDLERVMEDPGALDALEKNPRALAQMMRTMARELDEDLGPEFEEVVQRLEKGQTPEEIEQALPELSDAAADESAPAENAPAADTASTTPPSAE